MKCPEDPTKLCGQPIGQYHCPECGCMQVACMPHMCMDGCLLEDCEDCQTNRKLEALLAGNVALERYCPRADAWLATWGPGERVSDTCAECGARVVYNATVGEGPVRLVCLDCLHLSVANLPDLKSSEAISDTNGPGVA